MASAQRKVKFGFNPITATQEYTMILTKDGFDEEGKKTKEPLLEDFPMKLIMKPGDTQGVTQKEMRLLIKEGKVRSKKQIKERDELIANRIPMEKMSDDERKLVLSDRPMEL